MIHKRELYVENVKEKFGKNVGQGTIYLASMYSFKEISPNRKLGLKGLKNGKYVMSLTSIYGRGPWKFTDSSTSRHGEVTAIVLVDQEVWGWIWYLFLQHNHQRRTPYKLVKINLNNITIPNEPFFLGALNSFHHHVPGDYGKERRKSDPDETD